MGFGELFFSIIASNLTEMGDYTVVLYLTDTLRGTKLNKQLKLA